MILHASLTLLSQCKGPILGMHSLRLNGQVICAHHRLGGSESSPVGRSSFVQAADSKIYRRAGEEWIETDSSVPVVEVDGLGLSLLSVTRDVEHLEPTAHFDPLASALDGAPVPQSTAEQLIQVGPWLATAAVLRHVAGGRRVGQ